MVLLNVFRNFLMATLNYSVYGNSAANVGAGFTLNLGPLQLYTITDNVIAFMLPEAKQELSPPIWNKSHVWKQL